MRRCLVLFCGLLCLPTFAADIKVVDTTLASRAAAYRGFEQRPIVDKAALLALKGDTRAAWSALAPVLAYCDTEAAVPDRKLVSVTDAAEEKELRTAIPNVALVFIDVACPSANKLAAFLAVRENDTAQAFSYLDRAQALAPYLAEPVTERAYLVGSLGDREGALAIYRNALLLSDKYPGSAYMKPVILRGIGFSLTELGDLDGAERAYQDSLLLEPASEVAKNELKYLKQLRARKGTSNNSSKPTPLRGAA